MKLSKQITLKTTETIPVKAETFKQTYYTTLELPTIPEFFSYLYK